MLHPSTRLVWVSDDVGHGVVATEPIPAGTILWVLDSLDRLFSPQEVRQLGPHFLPVLDRYAYVNGRGERVLCWDHGRFMNHSCSPVSLSPGVDFELAVRDIAVGEEITADYGSLNLEDDMRCLCGEPDCRGVISANDFDVMAPVWDQRLRAVIRDVTSVPQPLIDFVRDTHLLDQWAADPATLPSSLRHRYPIREVMARTAGR